MKRILIGLAILALLLAGLALAATLLATGKRPVPDQLAGYHETTLSVGHRDVPVSLHIWYPAEQGGAAELVGQNALFYGQYVIRDARPIPGAHPVVVFSHGSGGNANNHGWLATELARQGMIVVAPNHPGTMSRDSDPHRTPHIWERVRDLHAILDHLESNPPLGLDPDMDRVASVGFSLGGFSALSVAGVRVSKAAFIDYCDRHAGEFDCGWMQAAGVDFTAIDQAAYEADYRDPRIKATVSVDPALPQAMTGESLAATDLPILLVSLGQGEEVPPATRVDAVARQMPQARLVETPGAWHFSFLSECSTLGAIVIGLMGEENICSDAGMRDRGVLHEELKGVISSFLNENLALSPSG